MTEVQNVRTWLAPVLSALAVLGSACSGGTATEDAVRAYFDAWNARDVDAVMATIADEPALEVDAPGVVLSDRDRIRDALGTMFARSEWTIELDHLSVDGDTATYNYVITDPDGEVLERGHSEAVVEDGRVRSERRVGPYRE